MGGKPAHTAAKMSAVSKPKQSLCATHPANYSQAAKVMPQPHPLKAQNEAVTYSETANKVGMQAYLNGYPTPSPSPPHVGQDLQSRQYEFKKPGLPRRAQAGSWAQSTPVHKPATAKPQMPWECHTDPTLTASDAPVYWSRNHTILKSDTDLSYGSVVSPTFMHGMPFGTMVEAAYHYPSKERLEELE